MMGRWSGKGGLLWFEDNDEEEGIWVAGVGDGEEGLRGQQAQWSQGLFMRLVD